MKLPLGCGGWFNPPPQRGWELPVPFSVTPCPELGGDLSWRWGCGALLSLRGGCWGCLLLHALHQRSPGEGLCKAVTVTGHENTRLCLHQPEGNRGETPPGDTHTRCCPPPPPFLPPAVHPQNQALSPTTGLPRPGRALTGGVSPIPGVSPLLPGAPCPPPPPAPGVPAHVGGCTL